MSQVIGVGVLVEHSVWGRGKVVEVRAPYVMVHFPSLAGSEQGPRRKLQLDADQLSVAPVQSDSALDGVAVGPARVKKAKADAAPRGPSAKPLDFAMAGFQAAYPGLFADPKLVVDELGSLRAAHQRFVALFGEGRGREMLRSEALAEIASSLVELYRATGIASPFERMAACDGFKDATAARRVLKGALDFVDAPAADTFQGLTDAIGRLPAPGKGSRVLTWPNVTLLPFLADPSRFMVLKPGIARQMAARMGFDLFYSTSPEWRCYEALQRMFARLRDDLRGLGATDAIDVQTFMWVTRDLE